MIVDVRSSTVVIRKLIIMIHLYRIKGAELGTVAAVHADVDVDEKFLWLRHRAACYRITAAYDPDALRRADLGADTAACAPVVTGGSWVISIIHDQEGHKAEALWHRDLLFRVLYGEEAARFCALPRCEAFVSGIAAN